ncbi:MAG TPA: terminase TerL endonuclease subunit [Stellaceae bacterium]|nr:terminase TerL endonuclease subunit [Stellaceae bacterium]
MVNHWIFTPTKADPIDFEQVVERTLLDIQKRYDVQQILFDPYQMQGSSQRLQRAGVPMREYPQTTDRLTTASQGLYDLFKGGGIRLYDDPEIRLALMRAVAVENARGWKISKTQASHKIDVVISLAQAAHGAVQGGEEPAFEVTPIYIADSETAPIFDRWKPNYSAAAAPMPYSGGIGGGDHLTGTLEWEALRNRGKL